MIAEVIPEKRTGQETEIFSYSVPEGLTSQIKIGSIVYVPFGKKTIRGVVTSCHPERPTGVEGSTGEGFLTDAQSNSKNKLFEIKSIISVNPDFTIPKSYLEIAEWVSEYYLCSLGEAISLFTPPEMKNPRNSKPDNCAKEMVKNNKLSNDQKEVFEELAEELKKPSKPALLFGVTGSGKTEIYLKLAEECIKNNKQVIVLVPEIMLTPQIVDRFCKVFGDEVTLIHSELSKSEKFNAYKQFALKQKKILVGPRSALLVPSDNIGLIIIDEEQESAYKQEKTPRYHAVNLARRIADKNDALLLLGSATPRVETFFETESGLIKLYELKSRFQKLILPPSRVVDLKNEIKKDNLSPISLELQSAIKKVLSRKKQIILFLNRRGTATFVSCRECGEVIACPRCSIPLIYHIHDKYHYLHCHHCDYRSTVPNKCPACGSLKIKFFGSGVEKIEQEIKQLFPRAKVRKIDSESLSKKNAYENIYEDLNKNKIDILIGTQILAKGLDMPDVELVGIVSADVGLHLPYFRANEKVFQLITQVSGRSGRRDHPGQTIIQTYWPESKAIMDASLHNYHTFYEDEITDRKKGSYPPFCRLVRIVSENINQAKAKEAIVEIAKKLNDANIEHIGPGKCFLSKLNRKFRYHIIVKIDKLPNKELTKVFCSNPYIIWDVDPIDML